jgi:ABC-type Fe3+ transport system permease subunit
MILEIVILLLAVPVGFFIAWLTKEELRMGRKWFRILIVVSLIGIIGFWIYGVSYVSWTFGFIGIVSTISLVKASK